MSGQRVSQLTDGCGHRVPSIGEQKDEKEKGNDDEDEAAGFGAEHAAGEPVGAGPGSLEEVADAEFTSVASRGKEHRCPVESGVESDDKSERAGAANGQAAEKAEQNGTSKIFPALEGLFKIMQRAEADGQKDGCWPEADAVGQGAEQVTAEGDLFGDTDGECSGEPPERGAEKRAAVNRNADDAVTVKSGD